MTNDPGGDLRDRFKTASLPPAPVRLRERLETVASSPVASTTPRFGRARLVVALAAAFAIASIGLMAVGGIDDPGPSPTPLTAEASITATPGPTTASTAAAFRFEVVCEEAEPPALSCAEIVARVLDLMGTKASGSIARMEVRPLCDPLCRPGGSADVTSVSGSLLVVSFWPDGTWQMTSSETFAPTEEPTEDSEP